MGSRSVSTKSSLTAQRRVRLNRVGHLGRFRQFARDDIEQSIVTRFERQVAQYPDHVAVNAPSEALTYRALDAAGNRLARVIASHGRQAGDQPVALLFGQSVAAVTSTLGVLKASRPYVPLDSSQPQERLVDILNDAQATLLVTDSRHLPLVSTLGDRWPIVNVDELDSRVTAARLPVTNQASALAALFYTSGSTGTPKGVMQDHRSILHRVLVDTNGYGISPDDRLSLLSPPTYSISLRILFGALLNGATVCPFDVQAEGLGGLSQWLAAQRITVCSTTSTVFRHLASTLTGDEHFDDLRVLDVGGEGVLASDVELYRRHFPATCVLSNTLGCNEAGVYRRYVIDKQTAIEGSVVPVGYEVPDKEVVILTDGKKAAANQIGEIALRTRYLPRGYWGRPDLTAAAFVPDPQGGDQPLYLTGDLGEMLPDGCLVYRGRTDARVKIRGQFVDLADLENSLLQHDEVREAAVHAVKNAAHRTQLVAFIVPSHESQLTIRKLRQFLTRAVPAFMVPSRFVFLRALPTLANGKVDRRALASLADGALGGFQEIDRRDGPAYVAPVETIEHQLVQIWEELLRVHPISVRDNFFDLGGDSLLAMQMIAEVESRCGEVVPPAALMGATLGDLARALVEQRKHSGEALVARVQAGEASSWPLFFLSGDFDGGGFYCLNLARALGNEQRFYAVTAHGLDGGPVPPTIEGMAASYVEMIQEVEPQGPYLLGGLCHAGLVALEMARQLERKGHTVGLVAMIGPPAWNPTHWRWIKNGIAALVRRGGGDADDATDVFLALRERRMQLRQFYEYAVMWMKEITNTSMRDRMAIVVRLARRLTSGALVSEKPWTEESFQPPPTDDELMTIYRRAVASYVRRPYAGRLSLLWPEDVPFNTLGGAPRPWASMSDPTLGWGRVASDLEVHALPGDYTTSITIHVQALADLMKASVKQAQAGLRAANASASPVSTSHEPVKTDGPRSRWSTYPVP